jgi:GNAT superfamily N-acetyltransferase
MIRTPAYLQERKEALIRKHPALKDLRIVTVQGAGWDHRRLSGFIESCWRNYYGAEESRLVYSPEFLEWQIPELQGICALDRDGRPVGCLMGFPRSYRQRAGAGGERFSIGSCLGILPDHRGRGIAQLLVLALQERDVQEGLSFSCCYLDPRKKAAGSAFRLWGTRRSRGYSLLRIPLLAKTFDWRKSRQYGSLNLLETAATRGAQTLFPSRRGRAFPGGRRVEEGTREHLPAVRDLFEAADRNLPVRRVYEDEALVRIMAFRKNAFHALSYFLMGEDGRADGLLFGYKLPLRERDCAFFTDGLVFRPGLPYRLKRSFLSECEGRLRDLEGCVGVTLLSTASPENLLKYGYIPYSSQILGMDPYVETVLSPRNLRDLRIELR